MPRFLFAEMVSLIMVSTLSAQAVPDRLQVSGTLAFDAEATLGDFTGTTSIVAGLIRGADAPAGVKGHVTSPARSLKTGNGKRDRDMYKSLETDRYHSLRFDLDSVLVGPHSGDSLGVALEGRFTIHGVTRQVVIPGWAWLGGDVTRFRGQVLLNLKDYRIGGLSKFLGVFKMHELIVVRIDLEFRS